MHWNDGLQGQALQIAASPNSPLCVVAGPGTGKTFALMRRLTRLLEVDHVAPERILACTFTRTAAEDITRAILRLGVIGAENIRTQTVHGFCFSMLSAQDVLEATGRVPRPLLGFEERFLLQDLCKVGLGGVRSCGKKLKAFSAAWARLQHDQPGWPHDVEDQRYQVVLLEWLRFHEAILIGELIPEGIKYLRNNPQSPYRSMFNHMLVDEYQDLNRAEQYLVDLLANGNLVVVGDEDQSIYSFKHAHPEGIVEFPGTHPNTEEAGLDQCRRCPQQVVGLANALISHNVSRSNRQLQPMLENPAGEIHCVQWSNMQDEAEGIASFIKSRVDARVVESGNVLVLAPRREFGYLVRDQLNGLGVPAHSFFSEELLDGDPKNTDESRAQQAMALLILLANPDDRVALRCWCGFGNNTLADAGWARLRAHCKSSGDTPWQTLKKLDDETLTIPYTGHIITRCQALKLQIANLNGLTGHALVDAVFPTREPWAAPFVEIATAIDEDDFGPRNLIDTIRRHVSQPEMPTDVDYVRVMSLHKSKGLNADLVVVCGCIQGLIPSIGTDASPQEQQRALEEQRRLFYVAITRTRQTLVLSSVIGLPTAAAFKMRARTTRTVGTTTRTITSQFIHELGSRCPTAATGQQFLAHTALQK
ncbi:MAG: ATP-dependent helicase [bacterium]|nr:ATP-dependent helicase [bacterium]